MQTRGGCRLLITAALRKQEMEALGDFGGIGDDHRDTAGAQQMPQPDLTADTVAVRVDMRRQNDVAGAGERRRHVARRLGTSRWNRNPVRVHAGKIIASYPAPN